MVKKCGIFPGSLPEFPKQPGNSTSFWKLWYTTGDHQITTPTASIIHRIPKGTESSDEPVPLSHFTCVLPLGCLGSRAEALPYREMVQRGCSKNMCQGLLHTPRIGCKTEPSFSYRGSHAEQKKKKKENEQTKIEAYSQIERIRWFSRSSRLIFPGRHFQNPVQQFQRISDLTWTLTLILLMPLVISSALAKRS
ncbi:hypothetical protein QG37_04397 [Candidozyma auris]|nr:hypothetical protein QG37_04397 [[Candida] auris]